MKKFFRKQFDNLHEKVHGKKFLSTAVDAVDTFMFTPKETTKGGVHIRDGMDLKRTMFMVVLPLLLIYMAAAWNIGHLHYHAAGMAGDIGLFKKLLFGLLQILPVFVVVHVVGLGIEILFAAKKGHAVEEGFLVTGALIPLIMPPAIPLWMVALATAFAVIFAKEAFGGTGMNIWNVALVSRAFVFFAYPAFISGDVTPILDAAQNVVGNKYVWIQADNNFLHKLFAGFFHVNDYAVVDGYSGATPLAVAAKQGWTAVLEQWSQKDIILGLIPGSIGEMFKPLIALGALWLVAIGIGSWRIMVSMLLGAGLMGLLFNAFGADVNVFFGVPWFWHYMVGSFLFAMAFMATDPVTAAQTNKGKFIYGFLIGVIGMIVRVINPAYPEGWMLAILFVNTFAPLIDHIIVSRNVKKRIAHATN